MTATSPKHPILRWIWKRRGECTAVLAAIVVLDAVIGPGEAPVSMLAPRWSATWLGSWLLLLVGVGLRVWAAGNVRKNEEITMTGIYVLVRHPLYLGTLLIYLSVFLVLGNLYVGLPVLLLIFLLVYYPIIQLEETWLARTFPDQAEQYRRTPLLIPKLSRLPLAIQSDRFSLSLAVKNLGLRALAALVLVPGLIEIVRWLRAHR